MFSGITSGRHAPLVMLQLRPSEDISRPKVDCDGRFIRSAKAKRFCAPSSIKVMSRMISENHYRAAVDVGKILIQGLSANKLHDFVYDSVSDEVFSIEVADAITTAITETISVDSNSPNLKIVQATLITLLNYTKDYDGSGAEVLANTLTQYSNLIFPRNLGEALFNKVSNENLVNLIGAVSYRNIVSPEYIAKVIKSRGMNISDVLPKIEQVLGDDSPIYTSLSKLA